MIIFVTKNKKFFLKMTHLLTIGAEYSGRLQLYGCAVKSADIFESFIKSKTQLESNIRLRGKEANVMNITKKISSLLTFETGKIIIYYAGHGDHIGTKEHWLTSSGVLDQIRLSGILNCSRGIEIILISESCSSEHMINSHFIDKNYVYYGATQDYEDANMTCDGGIFTQEIIKCMEKLWNNERSFKHNELMELLLHSTVEVEHFSVRYSSEDQKTKSFF